jgi:Tol biopolymer transport system component
MLKLQKQFSVLCAIGLAGLLLSACSGTDLSQGLSGSAGLAHKKPTPLPVVVVPPTATDAPLPPPSGHIVFVSSQSGKKSLYLMNADGTHLRQLTNGDVEVESPHWSPDGTRIAFASTVDKNTDIYVLNLADGSLARLTSDPSNDSYPGWSPDGRQIVFESFQGGRWGIYVVNADGTGLAPLVTDTGSDINPVWSPDGASIAFVSTHNGSNADISLAAPGGRLQPLTADLQPDSDPAWSPDGKRLAFRYYPTPQVANICVMNRDGSNRHCLTDSQWENGVPAWSPDGHWLAFRSMRGGTPDIDLIHLDDGSLKSLVTGVSLKGDPIWSPDNLRLVFPGCPGIAGNAACAENTNIQIYSIAISTHEVTQLTQNSGFNGEPAWTSH